MQRLVDGLAAAGNDAHGEMLSATEHDIAEVILQRARIATSTSWCLVTGIIAARETYSSPAWRSE